MCIHVYVVIICLLFKVRDICLFQLKETCSQALLNSKSKSFSSTVFLTFLLCGVIIIDDMHFLY